MSNLKIICNTNDSQFLSLTYKNILSWNKGKIISQILIVHQKLTVLPKKVAKEKIVTKTCKCTFTLKYSQNNAS